MDKMKVEIKPRGLEIDIDRQAFALSLKSWRLRQNLTQQQVAEMWNCSRWTIMRAELAKPITWEMAYRLFAKLAVALETENPYEVHDNR